MPIEASEPTVISASYPYWAVSFHTSGFPVADPGGDTVGVVSCSVTMVKFRIRDDGIPERSPLQSDVVTFYVPDLYALAALKPGAATALTAMLAAIAEEAADRGVL